MYLHKFDHFDKFRAYLVYYRKKSFFEKFKKKYFCPNGLNFCVCLKDICGGVRFFPKGHFPRATSQDAFSQGGQFPRYIFPRNNFPRRLVPKEASSQGVISQGGQFPRGDFPSNKSGNFSRRIFKYFNVNFVLQDCFCR